MLTPKIPVAKEGYPFIGLAAFCTVVFALLDYGTVSLILLATTVFILSFFRDPERFTPTDQQSLVSPADGRIIIVEKLFDEKFTKQEAYKVSIFMNVFNVHVNRAPFSGTVEEVQYQPGKFYSADTQKGGLENEYCAMIFSGPEGQKIGCVQIAGLIARRIICWMEPGDSMNKGQRVGLIRFGSRVDLYLPLSTVVSVKVGDRVTAGESIIGVL